MRNLNRIGILSAALILTLSACISKPASTKTVASAPPPQSPVVSTIPFALHDNRLLVNVMLDGQGPFVMIFDTGGSNTLTPSVQKLLDLKSQGPELATGAGEKTVSINSVHVKSMQFGDVKLEDQKFLVINLNKIQKAFKFAHLDGIIGYELLQKARVRIDFDNQLIEIVRDDAPSLDAAGTMKFEFADESPVIDGKIDGKSARILLDTGDRSNLTLFRKFAALSGLQDLFHHEKTRITGLGIGGPIRGRIAPLKEIDLGDQKVTNIKARLPLTRGGYFFKSEISASAGIGLLKAFNLEFDYKHHLVSLQPRPGYHEESVFVPIKVRR